MFFHTITILVQYAMVHSFFDGSFLTAGVKLSSFPLDSLYLKFPE